MFNNQVLDYKDSTEAGKNISSETNLLFRKKYFQNSKPTLKFVPPFTPGEIYFYDYKTDSRPSKERPFIDRFPILLCTEIFETQKNGTIVKGIDLVVVPPRIRIDILGKVYDNFVGTLLQNEKTYEKGGTRSPLNLSEPILKNLLPGTGYKSALFGFKYKFIRSPGVISVEDWCKIPYLSYNLIEGLSAPGIYSQYQAKLNP